MQPSHQATGTSIWDEIAADGRMFLPIPERSPGNEGHHMFYGFPVTEEWASTHCDQNAHRILGYDPNMDMGHRVCVALRLVRLSSRIKNLTYSQVFAKDMDLLTDPNDPRKRYDIILKVTSTKVKSYMKRPTQSQFDVLQSIMGTEASWFVDVYPSLPGK
ncbi:hypothetical protein H0H92_005983 [Tricholoma furcatifolium]|nr:hypothetical protein H0H92_005983 [Tricholoma furcatifolium]